MLFCEMERFGIVSFLILIHFSSALNHSLITVSTVATSGVVLLTGPRGQYQFNFSDASEACLFKNISMATEAQLQTAQDHGLESCRFGWLSDGFAALPRRSSVFSCGSGLVGVVTWKASKSKKFGAWCFNSSAAGPASEQLQDQPVVWEKQTGQRRHRNYQTEQHRPVKGEGGREIPDSNNDEEDSTIAPTIHTTSAKTALQTTTFPTDMSTTGAWSWIWTDFKVFTLHVAPTAPTAPRPDTTVKPKTSAASTTVSTHFPTTTTTSLLGLIRSSSLTGSTPSFVSRETMSGSYKSATHSVSVEPPRQTVFSTALISFCFILLILLTGGACFYCKVRKRRVWSEAAQKDDTETEMWRQTSSELDLQKEGEDERRAREEEKRFTISSENMLHNTELQ